MFRIYVLRGHGDHFVYVGTSSPNRLERRRLGGGGSVVMAQGEGSVVKAPWRRFCGEGSWNKTQWLRLHGVGSVEKLCAEGSMVKASGRRLGGEGTMAKALGRGGSVVKAS